MDFKIESCESKYKVNNIIQHGPSHYKWYHNWTILLAKNHIIWIWDYQHGPITLRVMIWLRIWSSCDTFKFKNDEVRNCRRDKVSSIKCKWTFIYLFFVLEFEAWICMFHCKIFFQCHELFNLRNEIDPSATLPLRESHHKTNNKVDAVDFKFGKTNNSLYRFMNTNHYTILFSNYNLHRIILKQLGFNWPSNLNLIKRKA